MSIDAMKQALEALEIGDPWHPTTIAAIKALNNAIEQAQDPVAWVGPSWLHPDTRTWESQSFAAKPIKGWIPLYTAPQPEQKPIACDGDFPEGFDASLGVPAQALRTANAIMFDVIGKREWDVPCTAQHVLNFAQKYIRPQARQWQGLTDEEIMEPWPCETRLEFARAIEAKLREKNT